VFYSCFVATTAGKSMRPSNPSRTPPDADLAWAIGTVLAAKFAALMVIWLLWFAHPQASRLTDERVANALYPARPAVQERTSSHARP
jgi:hypothetical protein